MSWKPRRSSAQCVCAAYEWRGARYQCRPALGKAKRVYLNKRAEWMRWLCVLACVERCSARISHWKTEWSQEGIYMTELRVSWLHMCVYACMWGITGACCMFGGSSRVHLRQPCSVSVSKGTIGWLVLYVASQSGSVDNAFAGKCVMAHLVCVYTTWTVRLVRNALARWKLLKPSYRL